MRKHSLIRLLTKTFSIPIVLSFAGCGDSANPSAPGRSEVEAYLDANPELKEPKPETSYEMAQ